MLNGRRNWYSSVTNNRQLAVDHPVQIHDCRLVSGEIIVLISISLGALRYLIAVE